jgi:serine/threonine protein kinase
MNSSTTTTTTRRRMTAVEPGDEIGNGRYVVKEEINRGGTAVVYRGYDRALETEVALKVMMVEGVGAEGGARDGRRVRIPLEAVKREIKYATKIGKKSAGTRVVRLLNVLSHGEALVLIWELAKGVDVLDLINGSGGKLEEERARELFSQLVEALRMIHDNGFCHRDVKPENVIVCADGNLKLIDFGLAKGVESAKTRAIGTPDYMAPELLAKSDDDGNAVETRYDAKAVDVWASGVMLYIMLTGRYPFQDPQRPNNVKTTLQNVSKGNMIPFTVHVSYAARNLIQMMLDPDPATRITLQDVSEHEWVAPKDNQKKKRAKRRGVFHRLKTAFRSLTSL